MTARYGFYAFVEDWPDIIELLAKAEPHLRRVGRPAAADMLLRAYAELRDDLRRLGPEMALAGTVTLKEMERATRVRPDTEGGGGPRLEDSLTVQPIGGLLLPGSIGIANYDLLDANVEWWPTNEWGSSARVGSRLYGFFFGGSGDAPPSRDQFREHPLFQPMSKNDPFSGAGLITQPIPARHFIERSIPLITDRWRTEFRALRTRYEARLDVVARTMR